MKIMLVTVREIDPQDLDIWLRMYRDDCKYPINPETIKREKSASWTEEFPEVRSRATTTITLIGEAKP